MVNFALVDRRIRVDRKLSEFTPQLQLDKTKMEQVFINIFTNAIHAMKPGGALSVRTGRRLIGLRWPDRRIGFADEVTAGSIRPARCRH